MIYKPLIIVSILILIFYYWIGTDGREPFWQYPPAGWYNFVVDGFLKGHLHFPYTVDPNLLALDDPYDPIKNAPYRLHDMAYFKGKYYLYYGLTPALILFLPFKFITHLDFPENIAIMLFLFGVFVFSALTLNLLKEKYFPNIPNWMLTLAYLVLGLANTAPFMLKRTMMYEVASSCGCFFLMGGIYFLFLAMLKPKNQILKLLASSSLFALAIGGRPHFIVSIFIIALVWLYINKKTNSETKIKSALALSLPLIIYGSILALYNYFRFESPLEFGWKYILAGHYALKFKFLNPENIPPNLYQYILGIPNLNLDLPFIHLTNYIPPTIKLPENYFHIGSVGIFFGVPITMLIFLVPIMIFLSKSDFKKDQFPLFEASILLIMSFLIFAFLLMGPQIEFRYIADFINPLLLLSITIWFYFYSVNVENPVVKKTLGYGGAFLAVITILFGIAYGIEPFCYRLKEKDPGVYYKIQGYFKPILGTFIKS